MNAEGSRLFGSRPANTNVTLAFTAVLPTEITRLVVANVTGSAADYRLFHVPSGGTQGNEHALAYDVTVATKGVSLVEAASQNSGISMQPGDTLHVRSSTGDALVFTGYGVTANLAPR